MDQKERTEAANALVNWFNSQEISQADACAIMSKVVAKILVGAVSGPHTPDVRQALDSTLDQFTLGLVHDMNDRIFHVRRRS
jgi:hypothetical protein